jgi:hypothetical protein
MKPSREQYTTGYTRLLASPEGSELYWKPAQPNLYYVAFYGKQQKPYENILIKVDDFEKALDKLAAMTRTWQENVNRRLEVMAERKTRTNIGVVKICVGTIMYGSWGYDQTNVEFWEITELNPTGKSCTIKKLNMLRTETHSMQGKAIPIEHSYTGETLTNKRIQEDHIKIENYNHLQIWDGHPKFWSSYA